MNEQHSNAWEKGREAALCGSHRKPPKTASQKWKNEYEEGWQFGHEETRSRFEELKKQYPGLAQSSAFKEVVA